MIIKVTQDDINAGIRGDCEACPITLAAIRAIKLKPEERITVDGTRLYILNLDTKTSKNYRLPESAKDFIRYFDGYYRSRDEHISPFEFEIGLITLKERQ